MIEVAGGIVLAVVVLWVLAAVVGWVCENL